MLAGCVAFLATAMGASLLVVAPTSADAVEQDRLAAPATTKVMVVGDSISHASVGDYSWRYFAWRHWRSVGARVDLVGPKRDPYVGAGAPWPAVYADANFDQDHAATWGDRLWDPFHDRTNLMLDHRPDVVVIELGVNDLLWGWGAQAPNNMRTWVTEARALLPNVDFVLVEAPWVNDPRPQVYNASLSSLAGELDTPASRVVLARPTRGYVMGQENGRGDTYDMVHPNTRGQVKIAAAVTDAVSTLGVGRAYPRPLAIPAEGPRVVPVLRGGSTETTATWQWSAPPGATSYDVWLRRPGQSWARVVRAHPSNSYALTDLTPCAPHELRVLARKGWTLAGADVTSPVVTTRVGPEVTARARLRSTSPRRRAVKVTWPRTEGACSHLVRATYSKKRGRGKVRRLLESTGTRAVVRRIPRGSRVRVQVRAVGARNATSWSKARVVRVRR